MSNIFTSFVGKDNLICLSTRDQLNELINNCRNEHKPLENLNLTKVDVSNTDFSHLMIRNVIFNGFNPEREQPKKIFNVNFKGCIMIGVSFSHCRFIRCNFDKDKITMREAIKHNTKSDGSLTVRDNISNKPTYLNEVDFFFCQFETCRFRTTKIDTADFRYSKFTDCTLGSWEVTRGDFYMCSFCGSTNFYMSKFTLCSLTEVIFEQHCPSINNINKLVQEDYDAYHDIIIGKVDWSKHNPCAGFSHVNEAEDNDKKLESRIHNHLEAYRVYAMLSGIYNGKGLFRESNEAYKKAKRNEAKFRSLSIKRDWENREFWSLSKQLYKRFQILISYIMGYGFKMMHVIFVFLILVIIGGVLFFNKTDADDIWNSLAFSLNNTLGPYDYFSQIAGIIWASLQTAFGILLVGFLGFIMANRIRNNA